MGPPGPRRGSPETTRSAPPPPPEPNGETAAWRPPPPPAEPDVDEASQFRPSPAPAEPQVDEASRFRPPPPPAEPREPGIQEPPPELAEADPLSAQPPAGEPRQEQGELPKQPDPQAGQPQPQPQAPPPSPLALEHPAAGEDDGEDEDEDAEQPATTYEIAREEAAELAKAPLAEAPRAEARSSDAPPAETSPASNGGIAGLTPPSRRGGSGRFITDHIVELGFATAEGVDTAIEKGRATGVPPENVLLTEGAINPDQLARATAERFGLDHVNLSMFDVDLGAVNLIPLQAAKRFEAVPVAYVGEGTVLVAMTDPTNVRAVDDISIMTGLDVRPAVAAPEDVAAVMARISKLDTAVADAIEEGVEEADEGPLLQAEESADIAPVVKLVNGIIAQGVDEGASDIHFEPQGREIRVRYRVDGMLHDVTTIPRRMVAGVTSRLKIMGNLDIAERRLPQDGRISVMVENHPIDIRVASLPAVNGEKMVLRLLDKEKALITLDQLGMAPEALASFRRAFTRAYGATLVTGPTGSGKTTSLYAALNVIHTPEKNIVTIEDPAEYQIRGITQVQVNVKTGLTFAAGLRSIVRADPDVIMIGEIRDRETAQIAVESALTGHLVLSTLHTNDAPSAVTRLTEMGIEPFLTASAIDCVVSQRLVRLLCTSCKERTLVSADQLRQSSFAGRHDVDELESQVEVYEARGCQRCVHTGYKGRMGIYEAMPVNDEIRNLVIDRAPADKIRNVAVVQGMRTLEQDGLEKVKAGMTTIEEIARVTGSAISAD